MLSDLVKRIIHQAIAIQQIPAPTFHESVRADFVRQCFEAEAVGEVLQDEVGNVFLCILGSSGSRPVVVSAHLDTVFPLDIDLSIDKKKDRIFGPGIGDNSLGIAGLFGLIWMMKNNQTQFPGDLWLVANVGEEGLGDLRGMREVVERLGPEPSAYIVLEGMALGQVYHRGLGVKRYQVQVKTSGGHSWVDYGRPSAIHELAALINAFTALQLPARPRTTINVGVIQGGTTVNTIAAEAHLELDLRSENEKTVEALAAQVESLLKEARRPGVDITFDVIGHRAAGRISASHPLVGLARRSLESQGLQVNLGIGSTDANMPLSRGLPAVCIGLSTGGGAHTRDEFINTVPIASGLAQLYTLVGSAFRELS